MNTPALLPPPFANTPSEVDHQPAVSEDLVSAERALRHLASLMKPDDARCRALLELASKVKPVSHWGLNE